MNEALSTKDAKKLNKASALSYSSNPKDQDRARARKVEVDYKDLLRQINKRRKMKESFTIDKSAHKSAQKKAKLRNLAKGNTNPNEKAAAEKKAGGPKLMGEGSLHKWFKGSKSKDGKAGWVNVKTGGTCASDEPGEGTPKCVSSSKRASMTKAERESASRRKKAADPNQQQKSGAAKPTYVSTDKPKKKMKVDEACWKGYKAYGMKKKGGKMVPNCKPVGSVKKEEVVNEVSKKTLGSYVKKAATEMGTSAIKGDYKKMQKRHKGVLDATDKMTKEEVVVEADKKGKGSGTKDACYHKVKASAKVWPSAYASGRLVQCRKKGASNYGKSKSESYSWSDQFDFEGEYVQEGKTFSDWKKAASKVLGKKDQERNPEKAMDAGARLRRKKERQEYAAKISGSEDNVPDEMRD